MYVKGDAHCADKSGMACQPVCDTMQMDGPESLRVTPLKHLMTATVPQLVIQQHAQERRLTLGKMTSLM